MSLPLLCGIHRTAATSEAKFRWGVIQAVREPVIGDRREKAGTPG